MHRLRLPRKIGLGDYTSFSDETDLTARYMIIGGISCGTAFLPELYSILARLQAQMPFGESLEWKAITKKNWQIFQRVIDTFCFLNSEHLVDFHALVVDMHRFDHFTHNDGDREVSFDKMMFQCFHAVHSRYEGCTKIRCFHGRRDARYPIYNLHTMLNNKTISMEVGRIFAPYVTVDYIPVRECLPVQLADLLIGCTGAFWNRRKGYTENSPKHRVASRFQSECPISKLNSKTPPWLPHFDIWEFRMAAHGSRR